ncbi:unnamed protein product, partial [Meganyctiphanes norvegica]
MRLFRRRCSDPAPRLVSLSPLRENLDFHLDHDPRPTLPLPQSHPRERQSTPHQDVIEEDIYATVDGEDDDDGHGNDKPEAVYATLEEMKKIVDSTTEVSCYVALPALVLEEVLPKMPSTPTKLSLLKTSPTKTTTTTTTTTKEPPKGEA